ncbi:MAG TPA: response regulator [Gemmatimonadales bacterium]|nr:response regulator [Gemmatimonadales bacterium]
MSDAAAASRAPLVLLANAQEWVSRSLESILRPNGYTVLKAFNGRDALERAHRSRADVIILDSGLPETDVLTLTRALRVDPFVTPSTPILITFSGPLTRAETLDALRAGANGVWGVPLDTEEFLLRLEGHVRAKLDADQARSNGLTDARTGLYNARGLERRARELAAHMDRQQGSLACVALAADGDGPALTESLGRTLRASARSSDAVGRLGPREFAVLAPDTDAEGAVQLFQRLVGPLQELGARPAGPTLGGDRDHHGIRLRAGYDARSGFHTTSLDPAVLLGRALTALRVAEQQEHAEGGTIVPFVSRPAAQ